ncbi:MAG: four helix bundle protein [Vicingaceae bacterium]
MNSTILKEKTKRFAINTAKFCDELPTKYVFNAYSNQLIRASSSVGANYRAACRAKSKADFINKLKIVEEEADECMFFLELIEELKPELKESIKHLYYEAEEILKIIVSSIITLRNNK